MRSLIFAAALAAWTAVAASYAYGTMRLDSVVLAADRRIALRPGVPHLSLPVPPTLAAGETRLANVWVTPRLAKLDDDHLFPVLESAYPEPPKASPSVAERLLPKTYAKLAAGGTVRILAWGDSVTVGTFVPDPDANRWQAQFVRRLRARFPKATIELETEAWGGRNTDSYRGEPPGSVHNYREKVLDRKPDLIVSEFVNDAGFSEAAVFSRYGRIRDEFKAIGAEWVILTPHYVRPDWMGLTSEKNIDDDPRPYVKGLRAFTAQNGNALAMAELGFCALNGRGVPCDEGTALRWYRESASRGETQAFQQMGEFVENGRAGIEKNPVEAAKWYRRAAERGLDEAQLSLGRCYIYGIGVAQDYKEAVEWLRRSTEQGNCRAEGYLAWCYQGGRGVARDRERAFRMFQHSVKQGYGYSEASLGECYEKGLGVKKDLALAKTWYERAAAQGDRDAQQSLERLRRQAARGEKREQR